ncbi:MAG: hypothetical protein A3K19_10320 [Lentisphaerae bacterium RIFOXYB12_FULL_65_16]|nr:MAG: hypothetical protein A3K18_32180 [Lentisphaerae bacterium RIFOXYA12_64_32]OGV91611.1 MAG: hypothetical protein A3K19_10320 [Lentisphaerae bacterium RIFOXYB12_FULL_65_16]
MKDDPIVQEVRAARDRFAAEFGYDIDRMFAEIQRLQELRKAQGVKYVSFAGKKRAAAVAATATAKPRRPSRRRPVVSAYAEAPAPALTVGEKPGEYRTAPSRTPKRGNSRH